jgi:SAM-dependent methyltransferase
MMHLSERLHENFVRGRRVRVLASAFAELLPVGESFSLLDIGAGDGQLAAAIAQDFPLANITGIDLLVRPQTAIPVEAFDGQSIPRGDQSVDFALLADVLHHTDDPRCLLREARRICRQGLLLKDHFRQGVFAWSTLRFMDVVGNRRFGVRLPHHYLSPAEWEEAWAATGWRPAAVNRKPALYPFPASLLFTRRLHFVARLE